MTPWIDSTVTGVERVWQVLDTQVEAGRFPGYVAAVRIRGTEHVRAGGRTALEPASPPMRDDTQFRIASITKPVGAALTLTLVRDGVVALDDPIGRWLPEAAEPRVLVSPDGALDDTVPAERPVTVRDLLAGTSGWGIVMERTPLQAAMIERGVFGSPLHRDVSADEFVERVASLPLAFQPGAGWLYETGIDLLGMVLTRATGRSLADLVAERVTGPLGMASTGFRATDATRLATAYIPGPDGLAVLDPPDGTFAVPPPFEELGSGPGVHRAGRPAVLLRDGRRRRARADGGRGRAHDGGRAHRRAAEVRAGLPRRGRVVGPGHRGGRPGDRTVAGARPLGLDGRDRDHGVRRPGPWDGRRAHDPAGDDGPARRLRRLLDGGGRGGMMRLCRSSSGRSSQRRSSTT